MLAVRMHVVRRYVSMQFGKIHAESRHVVSRYVIRQEECNKYACS